MILLGVLLILLGWITGVMLLSYLGGALLIIGAVLFALALAGRPVGGRNWY